ncbi:MAG: SusC/RagA family TonB-linked outer membrane protein [Saprospiraceae bacterium]|nr:MAG: SusC/RagA family TonB-linked outer membrane protein [Saprospiraceae bacterium]
MKKNLCLTKEILLLGFVFCLLALPATAQKKVTGTVTDDLGTPLIGVTVTQKGTTTGTLTNLDGLYELNLPDSYTTAEISFSYIGYTTVTEMADFHGTDVTKLDVQLAPDVLDMEEVLVIGSSVSTSRKQLGNSINSVKAEELITANPQGLSSALQGKLPGAQITQNSGDPAGGFSVRLRGASTITGSSEPLYVVDGVIVSNSTTNVTNVNVDAGAGSPGTNRLADINPNDIERLEVINGGAAAAIYGSRAANGVVLITTKKGTSGAPKFSFSSSLNINELRKKVYVNLRGEQFGSATQRLYPIAGTDPNTGGLTVGANFSTDKVAVTRYDYQDQLFHTGLGTDQYLSVQGGNDQSNYYGSLSYTKNEGIIVNSDFQRYGARLRYNQSLSSWASFSVGINYSNSFSNEKPDGNVFWSPINSFNITNNIWDITKRDEFGNLQAVEPTRINPLSTIEDFDITQEVNRAITDFQLKLFPFEGFSIDYILGIDAFAQVGNIFIPPYPYAQVNPTYFDDGYASTANANAFLMNNDINAAYQTEISPAISSTTRIGFSTQFSKEQYTSTQGRGLAPFVETVNGASTILTPTSNTARVLVWGYYLQQTFGIKDHLFLTLAGRMDGSSVFGKDNRNQFYPKVSGSYLLSEEPFWKGSAVGDVINTFKLRASWGQSGSLTAIGAYERFATYNTGNLTGNIAINASSRLASEDIKPERQTELEFGADLALFKDRIGLVATYYTQDITDLLLRRALAASSGGTEITTNFGQMTNKGIELSLYGTPVRNSNFSWDFNINFSSNKNKVTNLGQSQSAVPNVTGAPIFVVDGEPLGVFFGTYHATNPDGSLLLTPDGLPQQERGDITTNTPMRTSEGQPTGTPLSKVIGDPNPDYILGLGSTLKYKNWSFNFLFEAVQGFEVFDADKRTRQGVGLGELSEQELSGELPRGYIWAIYPILEWRVEDGSFIKLREASLSYNIPKLFGVLNNTTISLSGRNLFSIDDFFSYDPETNAGGQSNLMRAVNFGNVPIPRTYTVSIKTNF